MSAPRDTFSIAALVTVAFHVAAGGGLYAAGTFIEPEPPPQVPVEVEIVEPPKPQPKKIEPPEPKPPEPKPPEPKVEPPKPKVKRVPRKVETRAAPPPPTPVAPPAPGPNTNNDAPAPVVQLPSIGVQGSGPPVAVGRPKSRKVGTGGDGTNTGGGGPPDSTGTGGPAPVSVASIKTKAKPLNPNLDTSNSYTPEARKAKVEGTLKVRLVVDEKGRVVSRSLVTRLGHGLDQEALKLARKLRFEPARDTQDRAVKSVVVWTFRFVLPR